MALFVHFNNMYHTTEGSERHIFKIVDGSLRTFDDKVQLSKNLTQEEMLM